MKPSHTMVNVDFHVSNRFCYSGLSMANLDSGTSGIHVFLSTSTMTFLWRATRNTEGLSWHLEVWYLLLPHSLLFLLSPIEPHSPPSKGRAWHGGNTFDLSPRLGRQRWAALCA